MGETYKNSGIVGIGDRFVSPVRVLVVDDYEAFRQFVCSVLKPIPNLQIVGQSSDGLDAVGKAEELRPDLILLDIGLPSLNGIEAARRILKVLPESKILFLTIESSAEIIEEALSFGVQGYVRKREAGSKLLPAVEAITSGQTVRI